MFSRLLDHCRRIQNARRFHIPFSRRAGFRIPAAVQIAKRTVPIAHPGEDGLIHDFLTCFINDEYGLATAPPNLQSIVDIGANAGFFSIAARGWFPAATIHAYEPNPRILSFTKLNAAAAPFHLFAEAVGPQAGTVLIEEHGDSNQARTITAPPGKTAIPQVALSTVIERAGGTIDLLKLDCEGAEWPLFATPHPWAAIQRLRMEYHLWNTHTFQELEHTLGNLGFFIQHHASSSEWGLIWAERKAA